MHNNNNNFQCKMCWNKALTFGVGSIQLKFCAIVFTQYRHAKMFQSKCYYIHFSQIAPRVCTLVLFILIATKQTERMFLFVFSFIFLLLFSPNPGQQQPTLPLLRHFKISSAPGHINIVDNIGKKYYDFGIQLLEDTTGVIIDAIENELKSNAPRINLKILQLWLEGNGCKPIAWSTLTNTLRKIELSVLATTIEQNL